MKHRDFLYRTLAALSFVAVIGAGCIQLHVGYKVTLYNAGFDPIHVGNTRCLQNASTVVAHVGGKYGPTAEYRLSRNDINLGTLKFTENREAVDRDHGVTITMTEPVYFDFDFESSDTSMVFVEYIRP